MMKNRRYINTTILALIITVFTTVSGYAQSIGGNTVLPATGTSSNVLLPVSIVKYPYALLIPDAGTTVDIFYKIGGSLVSATTSNATVPSGGICVNVGPSNYVAAITGGTGATLNITQLSVCPNFSGGSGGGGGGSVPTGSAGSPNPAVLTVQGITGGTNLNVNCQVGCSGGGGGNSNITEWNSIAVGSPSAYGTAPTGNAPGINAFVTNLSSNPPAGFTPNGNYATLAVGATSANVALPAGGGTSVAVSNTGTQTAFINFGTSNAVTATANNIPVAAGQTIAFTEGSNTYLAAIETGGATNLTLSGGSGAYSGTGGSVSLTSPPNDVKAGPTVLGALNANLPISTQGSGSLGIQVTGTFVGTLSFQATVNGTTWFAINTFTQAGVIVTGTTGVGNWVAPVSGYPLARVIFTAYTSGSATVTLNSSAGSVQHPITSQGVASNVTAWNGTTVVTGNGTNAGALRVTVASDSTGQTTIAGQLPAFAATPTVNLGTIGGAATAANQPTNAAQGSTSAGQTGNLIEGATTTAAPTYVNNTTNPISLDTAGNVRINCITGCSGGGGGNSNITEWATTSLGVPTTYGTAPTGEAVIGTNTFVTNFPATQPISAASLPLPSGAATAANQEVTAAGTSASSAQAVQGVTGGVALPVSLASQPLPTGAATAANQLLTYAGAGTGTAPVDMGLVGCIYNSATPTPSTGQSLSIQCDAGGRLYVDGVGVAQGSTSSGQTGSLIMGAVTTSAPTYTTGQTDAISLDTAGNVRINCVTGCSGGGGSSNITEWAGVTLGSPSNYGTAPTGEVIGTNAFVTNFPATQPISAASLPLPSGAATAANQTSTQGTVSPGTAPTNMNAAGCIYNSSLPSPTSGQSLGIQCDSAGRIYVDGVGVAQGSTTSGQTGSLIMGAVTTSAPTYTNAETSPLSLDTAGNVRISAASLPLPSGAATAANQEVTAAGSSASSAQAIQGVTGGVAVPVSGTFSTGLSTSGGWTPLRLSALTNTAVAIKGVQGQLGMLQCYNPSAVQTYIQIYNVASGSVTVGTTTPTLSIPIAPTATGGWALANPGVQFSTAISVAATTTATGNTAPGIAADCNVVYN